MLFDEKQATSTDVEGEYLVDEIWDSNGEITVKKAKNRYGHVALPRSGCWHDEKSMAVSERWDWGSEFSRFISEYRKKVGRRGNGTVPIKSLRI